MQQTKTKYEIEAEKRELERLLERRTQEVDNLTGRSTAGAVHLDTLYRNRWALGNFVFGLQRT